MITVLNNAVTTEVSGSAKNSLWLTAEDTQKSTGWTLKPEGLCKDDICIPIPRGRENEFVQADQINLSAFWHLMGKPAIANNAQDTWMLGESAHSQNEALLSLKAPDFSLPDLTGKMHSLTDFRRKRILLITWASW